MTELVGRSHEKAQLQIILDSPMAEFVAVYGRRRVGKTYLIREFFKTGAQFIEICGVKDGVTEAQLAVVTQQTQKTFLPGVALQTAPDWPAALGLLTEQIKKLPKTKKVILFMDELPWLVTAKSDLLQQLDRFWNTQWSRMPNLKVILCGSAASWMLEHLIHAKGGLHNRLTRVIALQPFTLKETKDYLKYLRVDLNNAQIIELYLAMGGVPLYLKQAKRGLSASQLINRVCFQKTGLLYDEYPKLFASLFQQYEIKDKIVRAISSKRYGNSREDILKLTGLKDGGWFSKHLKELEEAGFVASFTPLQHQAKYAWYRLIDEYVHFYLTWIQKAPKGIFAQSKHDYWNLKRQTSGYKAWSGYAFEALCFKHLDLIRAALGIESVPCETGVWSYRPKSKLEKGVQIDLIFDRADGVITLCEMKYSAEAFVITKAYAEELAYKKAMLQKHYAKRKHVLIAMVTLGGLQRNLYANRLVAGEVRMVDLF